MSIAGVVLVRLPKRAPQRKYTVVSQPLGLTVAFRVAPFVLVTKGSVVVAVGAQADRERLVVVQKQFPSRSRR